MDGEKIEDLDDIINFLKMREERNQKKDVYPSSPDSGGEEVVSQGTAFIFERVYGHGVGLSQ